ncbi:hypothetical protein vBCtySFA67_00067 [Clostridium phage vB_CtyS-FA67]|nr:hypothetical protein vBCtySFA67_00067 [Clostridium phage vB_CtyS-FA67]WMU08172.1 hypothetical protein vBCtySFA70_00068 [Clostridium phage vB_CtyS-FA70]
MQIGKYTTAKVVALIKNRNKIAESRFYKADLTASDLLIDLDDIIVRIELSDKQAYIVQKHWIEGYSQPEVARKLNVTQQMVLKQCQYIKNKIEGVLKEMGEID